MSRILLVEDDESLVDGLCYTLEKQSYEIEVARSVAEAEKLLRESFDLLLLDVSLPDGTGFSVCEKVRKSGSLIPR